MKETKPKLCIVGNLLGRNGGHATTQGQIVAERFIDEGFEVIAVSSKLNPVARLLDVLVTILRTQKRIDVLIVEIYSGRAFVLADIASLLAKLFGISTIFVLHGGNLPEFADKFKGWVNRVLRRSKVLVAPSTFLADNMSTSGSEVRIIPNVIDLAGYPYRLRERLAPKLIWMRAFHEIYNPRMAVEVLGSVKKKHPDASLVMAGVDKGLEPGIKKLAEEMGLSEAIRFPGFLNHEAKIREFSKADIFLNTNRIDNMPVALIEACAMGLPVVATCVGGIPDLIENGQNGLLVPDGDAEGMVNAVESLLKNPELAERVSLNGRRLAERSSWENVQVQWEELFHELRLGKNKPGTVGLPVGKVTNS